MDKKGTRKQSKESLSIILLTRKFAKLSLNDNDDQQRVIEIQRGVGKEKGKSSRGNSEDNKIVGGGNISSQGSYGEFPKTMHAAFSEVKGNGENDDSLACKKGVGDLYDSRI